MRILHFFFFLFLLDLLDNLWNKKLPNPYSTVMMMKMEKKPNNKNQPSRIWTFNPYAGQIELEIPSRDKDFIFIEEYICYLFSLRVSQSNLIFILASIRTKFPTTVDCYGLLKTCHSIATALSQSRAAAIWNANIKTINLLAPWTDTSPSQAQAWCESTIHKARFDQHHISQWELF